VIPQPVRPQRAADPQCPLERPAAFGEIQAPAVEVKVRTPTRHRPPNIGDKLTVGNHNADEVIPPGPGPASHTRPDRTGMNRTGAN
jgi:hypothetical protein